MRRRNSESSGDGVEIDALNALNEYMEHIHKLKKECTSPEKRREYWIDLYNDVGLENLRNGLRIGTAMVLIHPYFEDAGTPRRSGFKGPIASNCELGKLIHGAKCPNIAAEKDHIFPWSLGGLTMDANRADLCKSCNRGKSNTIVGYFPWGGDTPSWAVERIYKIRKSIGV